ncbi:DUF1593 domain-containing protein [Aerococcaceae bacterium zg-ZJ1578]|uniref:DUF1593 domain-containing protein n=1 Tax=Aerococcaceae bacterium zg-252 TaxID=2796928 RepID=UPI001A25BD07|nr:DUF1593 domain-containing protein [Aerococcaceae bacterium zg-1578]
MIEKKRTVITTDGEVDDMNSFLRYLLYSNEIDTAGIILTSSVYHYAGNNNDIAPYRWTGTEWINEFIDCYEKVYPNLIKHAEGYPTAEYLRSIYHIGNITAPGEMEEETDGSRFLEKLIMDDDPRTLYIQTWGGTNTTARALKSIQERYQETAEWTKIKAKIEEKIVIYIILDQDVTYRDYIAKEWNITVINDKFNFWYFAYMWKQVHPELTSRLKAKWNLDNIRDNHGPLLKKYALIGDGNEIKGEVYEELRGTDLYLDTHPEYERFEFISEGDSPSYFYLFENGLRNAENPQYGGWGGRFSKIRNNLYRNEAVDYNPHTGRFESEYTLTRWFDDIQDDFAARANWCIAERFEDAAHYPSVRVETLDQNAKPGQKISLKVTASDPNGLELSYNSWCYAEASSYWDLSNINLFSENLLGVAGLQVSIHSNIMENPFEVDIAFANSNSATFTVPDDAKPGDTFHIITEVSNITETPLKTYARRILTVI